MKINITKKKIIKIGLILILIGSIIAIVAYFFSGGKIGATIGANGIYSPFSSANSPNPSNSNVNYTESQQEFINKGGTVYTIEKETMPLDSFQNLDLNVDYNTVVFEESDHFGIEYGYRKEKGKPKITVKNNTLVITSSKNQAQGLNSFWSFGYFPNTGSYMQESEYMTIFYKKGTSFSDLKIKSSYSDFVTKNDSALIAKSVEITCDYGEYELVGIKADNMLVDIDYANIKLKGINTNTLEISSQYGEIGLENFPKMEKLIINNCDYSELNMKNIVASNFELNGSYNDIVGKDVEFHKSAVMTQFGECNISGILKGESEFTLSYTDLTLNLNANRDDYVIVKNTSDFGEVFVDGSALKSTVKNPARDNSILIDIDYAEANIDFN